MDRDGDGQSDLLELCAGFDPLDAGSKFEWFVTKQPGLPAVISIPVLPGRTYLIQVTSVLGANQWTTLETISPSFSEVHTFTDLVAHTQCFYRLEIKLDDP